MGDQPPHLAKPPKKKRWGRLILWASATILTCGLVVFLVADHIFNVGSNLVYLAYQHSSHSLQASGKQGKWQSLEEISGPELENALKTVHAGNGFKFQQLAVRRPASTTQQKWVSAFFDSEINVFSFDPAAFEFRTSILGDLIPTSAVERVDSDGLSFALNANFFGPDNRPLGWVVSESRQLAAQYRKWTGFFFVKGGRPHFGPRSLLDETPGEVTEAAQGYPSLMRDHTIFPYVDLAPDKYFDGKKITYRSLAGMRQDGTIVFILSGDGGVMNVAEIAQIAYKLRIQHATLWDGGRALQYRLKAGGFDFSFHAFNNTMEFSKKNWNRVLSPVFIGAAPKGKPLPAQDEMQ